MKRHLKIALLIFGTLGLILTINSGYAGRRLAGNLSNKVAAGSSSRQWVWQNPLPQGNTLQDFSFVDPNNGFAVGARGTFSKQQMRATTGSLLQAKQRTIYMAFLLQIQIREPL